jgi:dipeptidyl aminopeptidase/acylaminoacyl peptidase
MGGLAAEVPERYADASPIERLPIGVPQLLVHGDADVRVPVDTSRRYAEAARAAGDDVELVERPGEDHFVHLDPAGGAWADVVRWLDRLAPRG